MKEQHTENTPVTIDQKIIDLKSHVKEAPVLPYMDARKVKKLTPEEIRSLEASVTGRSVIQPLP